MTKTIDWVEEAKKSWKLGVESERERCERKVSSLFVKPNDPDFQGTDEEFMAYNWAINDALDLIRSDIELSKGKLEDSNL